MFPMIDKNATGLNLRRIMDQRGITVKDVQEYLGLASVQSIYHWLNGLSMPTVDNLYALSELFQMPIDDMVCGNRPKRKCVPVTNREQAKRILAYYAKVSEKNAA